MPITVDLCIFICQQSSPTVEGHKTQNLLRSEVLPDHFANVLLAIVNKDKFGATTDAMIPMDGGIE